MRRASYTPFEHRVGRSPGFVLPILALLCLSTFALPVQKGKLSGEDLLRSFDVGEDPMPGTLALVDVHEVSTLLETSVSATDAERWVAAHNKYRCIHGSPNLVWSAAVAASAQEWADKGVFSHAKSYSLPPPAGPAGENLAMGHSTLEEVVRDWYIEVNSCATLPGCETASDGGMVGHFTAMVCERARARAPCSLRRSALSFRFGKGPRSWAVAYSRQRGFTCADTRRATRCRPTRQTWGAHTRRMYALSAPK